MPDQTPQLERVLTAAEAARFLRISYRALLRLSHAGKIPCRKINLGQSNTNFRFLQSELETHLKAALVCQGAKPVPSQQKKGAK
jgi:excisionase family DNA binding protein